MFQTYCHNVISQVFSECDPDVQKSRIDLYAGLLVAVGIAAALGNLLEQFLFGLAGERLTVRLRQQSFQTIIKQHVAFFDEKDNSVGLLLSKLASDASLVKGVNYRTSSCPAS